MKSILIIGMGLFGQKLAADLSRRGDDVMIVDRDEDVINELSPHFTGAYIGDCTNEDVLRSLGVSNFDAVVVTVGSDFQSSLEITALVKELGAPRVIAKADRDIQAKFLLRNGADEVVYPEKQLAKWTAIRCSADHILDYMELDEEHAMFEVTVPEEWAGHTIGQIDIRRRFHINIMGVKKGGRLELTLSPDTLLGAGETMLVLGKNRDLQKCFKL